MKIAVAHLTRMAPGFVCVAGVDVDNGTHVRPVLSRGRLGTALCARQGGPFDMATVVDLGETRPVPTPPELEDHEFSPLRVRAVQRIEPMLFWDMLAHLAKPSLRDLFGPELQQRGLQSAATEQHTGHASLGLLMPTRTPQLFMDTNRKGEPAIRVKINTPDFLQLNLSVTDLRLHGEDGATPNVPLVESVARRIRSGTPVILSVGLTRAFPNGTGAPPVHWLQVNNIHLADDPCWRLTDDRTSHLPALAR